MILTVSAVIMWLELIDTCWDVNVDFKANISFSGGELIDTCWDVNLNVIMNCTMVTIYLIDSCWDVIAVAPLFWY